jgi:hypothetical protein
MGSKKVSVVHALSGEVAEAERAMSRLTSPSGKRVVFTEQPDIPEVDMDLYYLVVGGDSDEWFLKESGPSEHTSKYVFELVQ